MLFLLLALESSDVCAILSSSSSEGQDGESGKGIDDRVGAK